MIILGAGLAGLSAAGYTNAAIYEKEGRIGGTCSSTRSGGFTFDQGIHVLHTKKQYILDLARKKAGFEKKRRLAWIYSRGAMTKYPFQANTFGLPADIVTQCLAGFIEVYDKHKSNYENYQDWVYSHFGRGIADNFYLPYSEKFWTVKADKMTTDWIGPRVPKPDLLQVIRGAVSLQKEEFGPNALFRYPRQGGIQRLAGALLKKGSRIYLGRRAVKIDIHAKTVYFDGGTSVDYNKLISTIPLPELIGIIRAAPDKVAQAAKELIYNSVLCLNFSIKRKNISNDHWVYFPEEQFAAFRVSFPGNFSASCVPEGYSSVQAEVAYSKFKPLGYKDIASKVIRDLITAGIIKKTDKIKLLNSMDIKYAYVIYDHSRPRNVALINNFLRKRQIYNCGRYGSWEYQWMDDAIIDGKRAAAEAS
ncbi:MAG: FAD-dependent oxidoreductase [Candidatus Omnitrophota bacterium]|nr:FAD-dependent oxidoreductase [Candidatus Omnitrophota bacterium]